MFLVFMAERLHVQEQKKISHAELQVERRRTAEHRPHLEVSQDQFRQAIGDRFGTTREAVRQAEARLMARLREHLKGEIGGLESIRVGRS